MFLPAVGRTWQRRPHTRAGSACGPVPGQRSEASRRSSKLPHLCPETNSLLRRVRRKPRTHVQLLEKRNRDISIIFIASHSELPRLESRPLHGRTITHTYIQLQTLLDCEFETLACAHVHSTTRNRNDLEDFSSRRERRYEHFSQKENPQQYRCWKISAYPHLADFAGGAICHRERLDFDVPNVKWLRIPTGRGLG